MNAKKLLQDGDIAHWYRQLKKESEATAEGYFRHLVTFTRQIGMSPSEVAKLTKEERSKIINNWLEKRQEVLTPKSLHLFIYTIKSAMKAKNAPFDLKVRAKGISSSPTVDEEGAPSPDDIRRTLHHADLRTKTCTVLIGFAGLRFATMAKLKLDNIVDLDITTLTMKEMPAMIWVPRGCSKIKKPYRTFLIREGCEYLIEYFKERRTNGEVLTGESPLIAGDYGHKRGKGITPKRIASIIRKAMRVAGLRERPYVLRGYFDFSLVAARVQHTFQQYFMGHRGDIEAVYAMKKHLPPILIKPLREAFSLAEEHLTTIPKMESIEQRRMAAMDALKIVEAFLPNDPAIGTIKSRIEGR